MEIFRPLPVIGIGCTIFVTDSTGGTCQVGVERSPRSDRRNRGMASSAGSARSVRDMGRRLGTQRVTEGGRTVMALIALVYSCNMTRVLTDCQRSVMAAGTCAARVVLEPVREPRGVVMAGITGKRALQRSRRMRPRLEIWTGNK